MHVALVHDWLTGMRGGERVLAEIAALFPGAPIFTLVHRPGSVSGEILNHPIITSPLQRLSLGGRFYRPLLPLMPQAAASFQLNGYDLIVSSSHCVAKGVIPDPGSVHVCYCHTPMRYLWDQRDDYVRRVNPLMRPLVRMEFEHLRVWDVISSARVDHFIANSRLVSRRIQRYWRRRAVVIPPPIETDFFTPGGERGEHLLMVAALVPYKRVDVGMKVAARLGVPLRVVGVGPMTRVLRRQAPPGVSFLGWISQEQLREEYRSARALLVPNIEDFGMMTVEALACGTPVVGLAGSGTADAVVDGVHGALAVGESEDALVEAAGRVFEGSFPVPVLRQRAEGFSLLRFRRRFRFLLERILPDGTRL